MFKTRDNFLLSMLTWRQGNGPTLADRLDELPIYFPDNETYFDGGSRATTLIPYPHLPQTLCPTVLRLSSASFSPSKQLPAIAAQ